MDHASSHRIRIEPFGLVLEAATGQNLARLLRAKGIPLRSDCGGKGICGKCAVSIARLAEPQEVPRPALACQTEIGSGLLVDMPVASLINPSEAVDKATGPGTCQVPAGGEAREGFGIAMDLGTTTIAGFLCDRARCASAGSSIAPNPQAVYGADVMSRITAAALDAGHLRLLQLLAVSAVNEIARALCENAGISTETVDEMVVVGNPTMLHLFLGIDPRSLGQSPFRPVFTESLERTAPEVGLALNPHARVITMPLVAGFLGADLVGAALAQKMDERTDGSMLIDIGTNGEIILKANGGFYATSCATGPAFEGATIAHGMLALSGAIDSFALDPANGSVEYTVVRKSPGAPAKARGICGSGLISIAAALVRSGIVEPGGRFSPRSTHPNLRVGPRGVAEFIVARNADSEDIVLTQQDVRALQLAKGAIRAGINMLCRAAGISRPREIILAGSFGSHVAVEDLLAIGLLPPVSNGSIQIVGNAAGTGAVMAVLDRGFRKEAAAFARKIRVVELASEPGFQDIFLNSLSFPEGGNP